MKKLTVVALIFIIIISTNYAKNPPEPLPSISNIHWLGHASFRIEAGDKNIYIDPWKIESGPKADIILVTHEHGDHCDSLSIKNIMTSNTKIVATYKAKDKLPAKAKLVKPNESFEIDGIKIETVPAFNTNKFKSKGLLFHPPSASHVGYILTINGQRIYHAGDTDPFKGMKKFDVDIALLPVSGIYVMTAKEAYKAVKYLKPKIAIPMHIGRGIGDFQDAEEFKSRASKKTQVEILTF